MLRSISKISGIKLVALDGEIGSVEDYFFDNQNWTVRYLVVDAGSWLDRKRLLFSPASVRLPDGNEKDILIGVKKEMIENSPPVDAERPISRQQEIELSNYYDWPFYWTRIDHSSYPLVELYSEMREKGALGETGEDPWLNSLKEVTGYAIEARDGTVGRINDFLIDDESWHVQYIVVDTGTILPGKKILLAPQWFEKFDINQSTAQVDLSVSTIQNSPTFNQETIIDNEYEERLLKHFQRQDK